MRKHSLILILFTLIFMISNSAMATLFDRGSGLIYDSDLNLTWLQNANYSGSTMTWADAVLWADSLNFSGYEDWRLPYSDTCTGSGCSGSEMGHILYIESVSSDSPGIFTDIRPSLYWSANEYTDDTSQAWRFNFKYGTQSTGSKDQTRYAWAVREGDSVPSVPVAPEPLSSVLFITGGVVLTASRFRNIRRKR